MGDDVKKIGFTAETMVVDDDNQASIIVSYDNTHKLCLAPITPNNMINGAEYSSLRSKRKNLNHSHGLVDELLVEILCRLPSHKTAVLCKPVSKCWAALLSNPFFITRFIADKVRKHNSKIGLLSSSTPTSTSTSSKHDEVKINDRKFGVVIRMIGDTNPWIALMVHFNDPIFNPYNVSMYSLPKRSNSGLPPKLTIVGSCNDLLLYRAHAEDFTYDKIQLFISNIQTKQWLALPCLRLNNFTHSSVKIGLICDPYYTCINGNVALNNACQACVVAIPCTTPEAVTEFPAHLLSTNSSGGVWRNVLLSLPLRCRLVNFRGLFCSIGRLLYFHCLSITRARQLISFDPFDVDNDVIKCNALLLPEGLMSSSSFFDVFHEQLYVCDYSDNGFYRVWVLEDCKIGQWSLRHNIKWCDWIYGDRCHAKLVNQRPWFGYPIGFHPTTADIIYVRCDNCIVLCNFSSRKMEFVSELPDCRRSMSPLFNHLFQITLPVWPTPLPTF